MTKFGLVRVLLLVICSVTLANKLDTRAKMSWVPMNRFPAVHEVAGWFPPDKNTVYYICREHKDGGQYLGMFQKGRACVVFIEEKAFMSNADNTEALFYPNGAVSWTPMPDPNNPPPNLILAGFDGKDGEALYICRGVDNKYGGRRVSPGSYKFSRNENKCLVYASLQEPLALVEPFEILSLSFYGIASVAASD